MRKTLAILSLFAVALAGVPGAAQVRTIDPNQPIDSDLNRPRSAPATPAAPPARDPRYPDYPPPDDVPPVDRDSAAATPPAGAPPQVVLRDEAVADAGRGDTFSQQEVLSAAEGTFGKGAAGLAEIIERTLKKQGRPNAYISGREGAGAFAIGLRYGGGTLFHKVEGQMPVHWTGPSLGFDVGGDASKVFVLVYNLYDSEELFKRFPQGEGRLYFVGGFAATYLRRGNVVLIPIRLGVGWRQGVNLGYMKFSHKTRIIPF